MKVELRRQLDTMEVAGWVLKIIRDDKPRRGRRTAPHSARGLPGRYSNAKMRFQSFFMLITDQPFFLASSYSA